MSAWNNWRQRRAEKEWQRRQRRNDVCARCGMRRVRHGVIQYVDACNRFKPQEDSDGQQEEARTHRGS